MSLTHSVTFDPSKVAQSVVVAAIAAIYGIAGATITTVGGPAAPATADNDPEDTGSGTAAATTNADGSLRADSKGITYDSRIHSDPATLTDKGAWRKRRGTDKQLILEVEAAQKAAVVSGTTAAATVPPAPGATLPLPSAAAAVAPAATLALPPAAPLTPPPAVAPSPFESFVEYLARHTHDPVKNPAGRATTDWLQQTLASWGVPNGLVANVQHCTPEQIAAFRASFAQVLGE